MIYCSKCGGGPLNAQGVCPECGFVTPIAAPHQQGAPQKPSSFPTGLVVVLGGVGILVIAAIVYFAASRTPSGTIDPTGSPSPSVERSPDLRVSPSPTPSRSNPIYSPTPTPTPGLPDSFQRVYQGTIGTGKNRQGFSLTLIKSSEGGLTGTAHTTKTDNLNGSIKQNGEFDVEATPVGKISPTGRFKGRVTDGGVTGHWTDNLTGQPTSNDVIREFNCPRRVN